MNCPYCGRTLTTGIGNAIKDCYDCHIIVNVDLKGKACNMAIDLNKYQIGTNLDGTWHIKDQINPNNVICYTFAGEVFDPYSFKSKKELIERIKWYLKWNVFG